MKEIIINNKKIIIRQVIKNDASRLVDYLNIIGGESNFLTFGAGEFGISIEDEERFIEKVLKKENDLFIVAQIDDEIVGSLNFSGGLRQRTAHVGEFGMSVLKKYWGNGIGRELIEYLINWSQHTGIIRKINLRVRSDNERGIFLYKKLGFVEEGLLIRDFIVDDKFYDSLLMGLCID